MLKNLWYYFLFLIPFTAAHYRSGVGGGNAAPVQGGTGGVEIAGSQEYDRSDVPDENTFVSRQPIGVGFTESYNPYSTLNRRVSGSQIPVTTVNGVPQNEANAASDAKNNIVVNAGSPATTATRATPPPQVSEPPPAPTTPSRPQSNHGLLSELGYIL